MSAERSACWSPARTWLAVGVTAAVLGLAVAAGVPATSVASGPLIFVETLSARISGVLLSLGARAPFGYALVAGMVASVNPPGPTAAQGQARPASCASSAIWVRLPRFSLVRMWVMCAARSISRYTCLKAG
jgi:hypothetical protein